MFGTRSAAAALPSVFTTLPNGDGFMLLKITDKEGKVRREGVLLVDGKYEDILDLDVVTEWTAQQDPKRVQLGVMTAERWKTQFDQMKSIDLLKADLDPKSAWTDRFFKPLMKA